MNFDQNLIAPGLGVLGLIIVVIIYQWITKQDGGSGAVKKLVNRFILARLYL
jgi:K(+)-stimulated pyrophosphate-energized sodium pump